MIDALVSALAPAADLVSRRVTFACPRRAPRALGHVGPGRRRDQGQRAAVDCRAPWVDVREVVAVGDWLNDVPMFQVAGRSFAMAHASDEVKAPPRTGITSADVHYGQRHRGGPHAPAAQALTAPEGDQAGLVAFSENISGSRGNRGPGRKPPPSTGSVKAMTFHRQ